MRCYTVAFRQSLVQQVAEGMHRVMARSSDEQETVSPNGAEDADARLQLVPPTPVGMAPLQAAAASVAAKRGMQPHRGHSALSTVQGVLHQTPPCFFDAGAYLQAAFLCVQRAPFGQSLCVVCVCVCVCARDTHTSLALQTGGKG